MRLLDALFGWTGYEPLGFFLSGINIILNVGFCLLLQYIPLRRFLRVKPRIAVLLNAAVIVVCAVFYLSFPSFLGNTGAGQLFGFAPFFLLFMPLSFYLLRDCAAQNLFAIFFSQCATLFVMGVSNWLEFRFGGVLVPGAANVVAFLARLVLIPISLPPVVRSLRKLFKAWQGGGARHFWNVVWLIPAALCALTILSGNAQTLSQTTSIPFLLSRILSMAALLTCVELMTGIMNRERALASARMREELMNVAVKAREKTHAETLSVLESMRSARSETIALAEKIIDCARQGAHDEISELLRERIERLDVSTGQRVCENEAVNALAVYYAQLAREDGIEIEFKLFIPRRAGRIQNVDLTRIVGNMLENATEACRRMDYGASFIRLSAQTAGDMLVIGMNNSFDGEFGSLSGGRYISRKRESGVATGLNSIRSVALRYDGSVRFEAKDRVFKTSVRLDMVGGGEG
jgi:hypothetical protein